MPDLKDRFRGMIVGTAVGDAVGLPAEGIGRVRARRLFTGPWRHRFVYGRGMISDDTEHTLFAAQCLLAHPHSPEMFGRRLGWALKWWFAALPAGIGLATARACIKLLLGFSFRGSGVDSAGNGPAMRVAPIGAVFSGSQDSLLEYTRICTTVTHTNPKALAGAQAIALTVAWVVRENLTVRPEVAAFCNLLRNTGAADSEWNGIVAKMEEHLSAGSSVEAFAEALGLGAGVTGYIYHSVPVVLFAWHRHFGDFRLTLEGVLNCGGDADTTGAIAGALAGITTGEAGIPADWINGIVDWPRSIQLCRAVADRLCDLCGKGSCGGPVRYFWPGIIVRNPLFLLIVLVHGFRRLFPPY